MFLFTNAPVGNRDAGLPAAAAPTRAGGPVIEAIREGAQRSGVGFDYMLATAKRESALDPSAKAATSSATGLYQFVEQTWLGTLKSAGTKLGLSDYAEAITAGADGRYTVADAGTRRTILDLRRDPRVSAAMAGELTQRNREALGAALGREPSGGDLYAAHVLGAKGAATLIATAQASPARAAALDMPEAAAANRALFYDRTGQPRGAAELYGLLTAATGPARPAADGTASPAADRIPGVPEAATSYAAQDPSLRSLFQTDRRQGAVSDGVARLWRSREPAATGAAREAPHYFPRSGATEATAEPALPAPLAQQAAPPAPSALVPSLPVPSALVPLPPRRPAGLGTGGARTASPTDAPTPLPTTFFRSSNLRLRDGS